MGDYITALALKKRAAVMQSFFSRLHNFCASNFPNTA
jgi:hypothetical protein